LKERAENPANSKPTKKTEVQLKPQVVKESVATAILQTIQRANVEGTPDESHTASINNAGE